MGATLLMSVKERERKAIFELVKQGYIQLTEASKRLSISYRHCKRLWRHYLNDGDKGLVHKSRGRTSNRCIQEDFKQRVLDYYEAKLLGFGPTFASEKLALVHLEMDHETLRRWLITAGLWQPNQKRTTYRSRRERRACFGELVQFDGSFHDWFEDGRKFCLMNMVDDATGTTQALLFEEESTQAAMLTLWHWIDLYGVPKALYTDKRNVYVTDRAPSIEEQLAGVTPLTAFGLACKKLGIDIITAHSPQAKGRVERSNGTYQDRFVKELKYQKITSPDKANQLLKTSFCQALNQRFACEPRSKKNAHRKRKKSEDLHEIFCWEEHRQLQNDWTVRYHNRFYQMDKPPGLTLKPKMNVLIRRHLDGSLSILHHHKALGWREISHRPKAIETPGKTTGAANKKKEKNNATTSPWRQFNPGWLNQHKAKHKQEGAMK